MRFLLILLMLPLTAHAGEPLFFKSPSDDFRDGVIAGFVAATYPDTPAPYAFARTDLNGDGVPEYIVKPAGLAKGLSPHHILSLRRRQVTDMGLIRAGKMEISDKKSYGVRDVVVYTKPANDFYRETWGWNGQTFAPLPTE